MRRKLDVMSDGNNILRPRQKRLGILLMLTALLVASAVPAHAWYGYKSPHVFRAPQVVVPVVPFWVPYTYTDPPVVATPPP
jgi:hypothetical protein